MSTENNPYLTVPGYGQQGLDFGREKLYSGYSAPSTVADLEAAAALANQQTGARTPDKGKYIYDSRTGQYIWVPSVVTAAPATAGLAALQNQKRDGGGGEGAQTGDGYSPMSSPLSQSFNGSLGYNLAEGYSTALGGLLPGATIAGMIAQGMSPGQIAEAGRLSAQAQQDAVAGYVSGTMFGAPPSSADTFGGAGYGTPVSGGGYGVTAQTGGGTAAGSMAPDPAQSQGQGGGNDSVGGGFGSNDGSGAGFGGIYANGGRIRMATSGLGSLGGYSDGGQLLRGPGDGVSDSIPASIGGKRPARLADGEFVVPARIVSELGNGSTEAGARKLYAMLDRIQAGRKKSIGKGKVATNSRADKNLPA